MAGLKHYESSFAPRAIVNSASGWKTLGEAAALGGKVSSGESLSVPPTMQVNNIGAFLKVMQGKPINFGSAGAGSGNFPVLNYKKDTGNKDAVHDPMDSKQWGAGGQERSCPMASRGSWRRMYDIMFLSRCD
jgi:hypothetical protein